MAKPLTIKPVHPNAGIAAAYRRAMVAEVGAMHEAFVDWLAGAWANHPPEMAQDRSPAEALQAALTDLGGLWLRRFDDLALRLARHFTLAASRRSDAALMAALKRAGFAVRFSISRKVEDVVAASVAENVTLIKSIASQYLTQVEGAVMRSVQTGRDLGALTDELTHFYGVSKRRAAFIAKDQNNKATASVVRARQVEVGVTQAIWLHSAGGKHPRPTHVRAGKDRTVYDVKDGWLDPALNRRIWPGTEINCRCVSRSIVPGLERRAA
ncbi:MAG TPA: phage minor head protein [Caulobacteraceae bacterium]|nr:phage minor head protein [Caulobacteraceae bacterium]